MLDTNNSPLDDKTSNHKTLDSNLLEDKTLKYSHLITTQPHSISRVVISDLHLSANQPALAQAFLALLNDLIALPNLLEFYILGDWFDAWIGDDAYLSLSKAEKSQHWITPLIAKLRELSASNCQILIMHGNRDFLIGQAFCDTFNGTLITEPYFITIGEKIFRLEHGDALCIDDKAYQLFRKVMRNRLIQWLLLHRPLEKRQHMADNMRMKSQRANQNKSEFIMDVNADAVAKALQDAEVLLHGHTHRPAYFSLAKNKTRYVLGDWRVCNGSYANNNSHNLKGEVEAVIGMTTIDSPSSSNSLPSSTEHFFLVKYRF